jgi:DNA-binding transcriptional ArsR family regulator
MVVWMRGGAMNAGEISERFGCTWATTSRHLKVLAEAGLLIHERRGRERLYRVDVESLAVVRRWLAWFDKRRKQ